MNGFWLAMNWATSKLTVVTVSNVPSGAIGLPEVPAGKLTLDAATLLFMRRGAVNVAIF